MMDQFVKRHKIFQSIISAIVLIFFVTDFVLSDAWAAFGTESAFQRTIVNNSACVNPDTFSIPSHLGEIKYLSKTSGNKTIVHIQDAHCNYFAQQKIAGLIGYLREEYGIRTVNLEGGTGEYDLDMFTSISGEEIRREVAEHFVKTGEINGAEFYAINNPEKVELWGIENKDLYLANLKVYRNSLAYRDKIDQDIKELNFILNNLKRHIYPKELLNMDMTYSAYKNGNMDLRDYVKFLIEEAGKLSVKTAEFADLYLLFQATEIEEKIDFKKANRERNSLIEELKRNLSDNNLKELVSMTVGYKTKRISQRVFYDYILVKAKALGIDLAGFPMLSAFVSYINAYEKIDRGKMTEEMAGIEGAIKEKLYRNDTERRLNLLSKNLVLIKNIFDICLTKADYSYYSENKDSFDINNFVGFIEEESPKYRITAVLNEDISDLNGYLKDILRFYEYSFKRDEAFVENLRFSSGNGPETAMLLTGGFHSENLYELFKERGISCISILPNFTSEEGYQSPYFELLSGGTDNGMRKALRIILAKASMMQVPSLLSPILTKAAYTMGEIDGVRAEKYMVELISSGKKVILLSDGNIHIDDIALEKRTFGANDADIVEIPISKFLSDAGIEKDSIGEGDKYPAEEKVTEAPDKKKDTNQAGTAITKWLENLTKNFPEWIRALIFAPIIEELLYRGLPYLFSAIIIFALSGESDMELIRAGMVFPQLLSSSKFVLDHYRGEKKPLAIGKTLFAPMLVAIINGAILPFVTTNPITFVAWSICTHFIVNSFVLFLNALFPRLKLGLSSIKDRRKEQSIRESDVRGIGFEYIGNIKAKNISTSFDNAARIIAVAKGSLWKAGFFLSSLWIMGMINLVDFYNAIFAMGITNQLRLKSTMRMRSFFGMLSLRALNMLKNFKKKIIQEIQIRPLYEEIKARSKEKSLSDTGTGRKAIIKRLILPVIIGIAILIIPSLAYGAGETIVGIGGGSFAWANSVLEVLVLMSIMIGVALIVKILLDWADRRYDLYLQEKENNKVPIDEKKDFISTFVEEGEIIDDQWLITEIHIAQKFMEERNISRKERHFINSILGEFYKDFPPDLFLSGRNAEEFFGIDKATFIIEDKNILRFYSIIAFLYAAMSDRHRHPDSKRVKKLKRKLGREAKKWLKLHEEKYKAQGRSEYFERNKTYYIIQAFIRQTFGKEDEKPADIIKEGKGIFYRPEDDAFVFPGQDINRIIEEWSVGRDKYIRELGKDVPKSITGILRKGKERDRISYQLLADGWEKTLGHIIFNHLEQNADRAHADKITIRTSLSPDDEESVWIEIEDDGEGINEELVEGGLDRIFDEKKSFRDKPHKDQGGNGAFLSRINIEERMGGKIEVTRNKYDANRGPGSGVTIRISLPINPLPEKREGLKDEGGLIGKFEEVTPVEISEDGTLTGTIRHIETGQQIDLSDLKETMSKDEAVSYVQSIKTFMEENNIDPEGKAIINSILDGFLENMPMKIILSEKGVEGFFGIGKSKFIIIDKTLLGSSPIAFLHEIIEYVKYIDPSVITTLEKSLTDGADNEWLKSHEKKYRAEGRSDYFKNNKAHYIIRAFTRQVFGEYDKQLTKAIKSDIVYSVEIPIPDFIEDDYGYDLSEKNGDCLIKLLQRKVPEVQDVFRQFIKLVSKTNFDRVEFAIFLFIDNGKLKIEIIKGQRSGVKRKAQHHAAHIHPILPLKERKDDGRIVISGITGLAATLAPTGIGIFSEDAGADLIGGSRIIIAGSEATGYFMLLYDIWSKGREALLSYESTFQTEGKDSAVRMILERGWAKLYKISLDEKGKPEIILSSIEDIEEITQVIRFSPEKFRALEKEINLSLYKGHPGEQFKEKFGEKCRDILNFLGADKVVRSKEIMNFWEEDTTMEFRGRKIFRYTLDVGFREGPVRFYAARCDQMAKNEVITDLKKEEKIRKLLSEQGLCEKMSVMQIDSGYIVVFNHPGLDYMDIETTNYSDMEIMEIAVEFSNSLGKMHGLNIFHGNLIKQTGELNNKSVLIGQEYLGDPYEGYKFVVRFNQFEDAKEYDPVTERDIVNKERDLVVEAFLGYLGFNEDNIRELWRKLFLDSYYKALNNAKRILEGTVMEAGKGKAEDDKKQKDVLEQEKAFEKAVYTDLTSLNQDISKAEEERETAVGKLLMNTPLNRPARIVFMCGANFERSPAMEIVAKYLARQAGLKNFEFASFGLSSYRDEELKAPYNKKLIKAAQEVLGIEEDDPILAVDTRIKRPLLIEVKDDGRLVADEDILREIDDADIVIAASYSYLSTMIWGILQKLEKDQKKWIVSSLVNTDKFLTPRALIGDMTAEELERIKYEFEGFRHELEKAENSVRGYWGLEIPQPQFLESEEERNKEGSIEGEKELIKLIKRIMEAVVIPACIQHEKNIIEIEDEMDSLADSSTDIATAGQPVEQSKGEDKSREDLLEQLETDVLDRRISQSIKDLERAKQLGQKESEAFYRKRLQTDIERVNKITSETYTKMAEKYTDVRGKEPEEADKKILMSFIELIRAGFGKEIKARVLDVGTGIRDLIWFSKQGNIDALGIDISEGVVELINKHTSPELHALQMDMSDLGFKDEQFEGVRINSTLHHLPLIDSEQGADIAVREAFRVLKPGGAFVVAVKAEKEGLKGFMAIDTKEGLGKRFYQFYSEQSLRELLERQGFEIVGDVQRVSFEAGQENIVALAQKPGKTKKETLPQKTAIQSRQKMVLESFADVDGKTSTVRAVVGIPADIVMEMFGIDDESLLDVVSKAELVNMFKEMSEGLGKNGFGSIEDKRQIIPFIIYKDSERTEENYKLAVENAKDKLPPEGRIVLFAPETDDMKLGASAKQTYSGEENRHITVVPDAYTDANLKEEQYPDITARVVLARHIAFYYSGRDGESAIKAINNLLSQVSDTTIESIEDLLNISNALRIHPIRFDEITEWRDMQVAVATSL